MEYYGMKSCSTKNMERSKLCRDNEFFSILALEITNKRFIYGYCKKALLTTQDSGKQFLKVNTIDLSEHTRS